MGKKALTQEQLAGIIYNETSSLRPAWKDPKGPKKESNYDPGSVKELAENRKAIGHVVLKRYAKCFGKGEKEQPVEGVAKPKIPSEKELENPDTKREWDSAMSAAKDAQAEHTDGKDPVNCALYFYLRSGGEEKGEPKDQPAWAKGKKPAKSCGPFRNLGGGDVKAGDDVHIDVYNLEKK